MWWDDHAKKYRRSLIYKIFYVWFWPVIRWVLYNCMQPETAHVFAIHWAIPIVGRIQRIYSFVVVLPLVIIFLTVIRLLCLLPWFTFEPPGDEDDN
jgi:hypothetical protein